MGVSRDVELRDVLVEAGTLQVEAFIETNASVRCRRATPHDFGATVRNTAVGTRCRGSRGPRAGVGAEPGCRTTLGLWSAIRSIAKWRNDTYLTPYVAARIERALVKQGDIRSARRGRGAGHLWPTNCIGY